MEDLKSSAMFGLKYTVVFLGFALLSFALSSTSLFKYSLVPLILLTLPTIIVVHLALTFGIYVLMQVFGFQFQGEGGMSFFVLMLGPSSLISAQIQGMLIWRITGKNGPNKSFKRTPNGAA
jgi:hypothetical protein